MIISYRVRSSIISSHPFYRASTRNLPAPRFIGSILLIVIILSSSSIGGVSAE